jgi:hypothetical protein
VDPTVLARVPHRGATLSEAKTFIAERDCVPDDVRRGRRNSKVGKDPQTPRGTTEVTRRGRGQNEATFPGHHSNPIKDRSQANRLTGNLLEGISSRLLLTERDVRRPRMLGCPVRFLYLLEADLLFPVRSVRSRTLVNGAQPGTRVFHWWHRCC